MVAHQAQVPQPVQHIGVVAVPEERLRVPYGFRGVQERQYSHLVVTAAGRQHGANGRVGEGGHEVRGTVFGPGMDAARGVGLDRFQTELLAKASHAELVNRLEQSRSRERR